MPTTMRDVEWLPPLLERHVDRERLARIKAETPQAASSAALFMASPWLPEASATLNGILFTRTHLDHELADLVGLTVSQDNSCRYCFAATRTLLVMVGYPRERIARLEQNALLADLDDTTRAALGFARRLSRCEPPPATADVAALAAAGIRDMAYRELAAAICLWVFFNRVSTITAMESEAIERLPDRWLARLLRPLLAGRIDRTFRSRGRPTPLPSDMRTGPCADMVTALDGLPVAPYLRRAIDAMWASEILSRRTRGLMCATIARALGCPSSEAEAVALLAAEGVDPETVDGVLTHLDAPGLTDAERRLVRFARETVWYEPSAIQRRAIELRDRLGEPVFVETVGTVSMANMLCRLHMALAIA